MGTKSKGWPKKKKDQDRCTARGPIGPDTLAWIIRLIQDPKLGVRRERREARALLRRHARFILKHIDPDTYTSVQVNVIRIAQRLNLVRYSHGAFR